MRSLAWAVLLLAAVGGAVVLLARGEPAPEVLRRDAATALQAGRPREALESIDRLIVRNAAEPTDLLRAVEAASRTGETDRALGYLDRLARNDPNSGLPFDMVAGQLLLQAGRAAHAEARYRRALARQPAMPDLHRGLAGILSTQGRHHEASRHLFECLRLGDDSIAILRGLGHTEHFVGPAEVLEQWKLANPDDPRCAIGLACLARLNGDRDRAQRLLGPIAESRSGHVEARALLGLLLADAIEDIEYDRWRDSIQESDLGHPLIWLAQGLLEERASRSASAIRCYWEAAVRDPDSRLAHFRLGHLLAAESRPEDASAFLQRATLLLDLERAVDRMQAGQITSEHFLEAASLTERLGRDWEARGWYRAALHSDPSNRTARTGIRRIDAGLAPSTPRVRPDNCPAIQIDLSAHPLPTASLVESSAEPRHDVAVSRIAFMDQAADAGVDFAYFNGDDPTTQGMRILETTGGGVAAFDYDLDGWVDLLFTQGCAWPEGATEDTRHDRMFRNRHGESMRDVTIHCGLRDGGFGQGVATGDIDNDGFVDLYLARLGGNRLYRNEGDGTFASMCEREVAAEPRWTTSCAIVDLNADSIPDLYDVNYVEGDLSRICLLFGPPRACPPSVFAAAEDRLLLGNGDGSFRDASAAAGIHQPHGAGLGLVVADFDASGRLGVFVANDERPNFLLVPQTAASGPPLPFANRGVISGVAYNEQGQAQASMGVAAGDVNGDGLLDLTVTNFFHQGAALYLRRPGGLLFQEVSVPTGLRDATFKQLGFGAQLLDADLDGWQDLVVANGHVDDFRFLGAAFHMPAQCFRNVGGRFVEVPAEQAGAYFSQPRLGRAVTRLDWNRDGREDLAISNMLEPAALLTNVADATGHFLAIDVHAVSSARDAIGTTVSVSAGGRVFVRQLTAGDGYQACNQRQLVFGLGTASICDELAVVWPSGVRQRWSGLTAGRNLLLIEGAERPFDLTWVSRAD